MNPDPFAAPGPEQPAPGSYPPPPHGYTPRRRRAPTPRRRRPAHTPRRATVRPRPASRVRRRFRGARSGARRRSGGRRPRASSSGCRPTGPGSLGLAGPTLRREPCSTGCSCGCRSIVVAQIVDLLRRRLRPGLRSCRTPSSRRRRRTPTTPPMALPASFFELFFLLLRALSTARCCSRALLDAAITALGGAARPGKAILGIRPIRLRRPDEAPGDLRLSLRPRRRQVVLAARHGRRGAPRPARRRCGCSGTRTASALHDKVASTAVVSDRVTSRWSLRLPGPGGAASICSRMAQPDGFRGLAACQPD